VLRCKTKIFFKTSVIPFFTVEYKPEIEDYRATFYAGAQKSAWVVTRFFKQEQYSMGV
jgi:hypothetical protein